MEQLSNSKYVDFVNVCEERWNAGMNKHVDFSNESVVIYVVLLGGM